MSICNRLSQFRLFRGLPVFLAAALQVMPMVRSLIPNFATGPASAGWSIILKIGVGTAALMGSNHAVSGASTIISPVTTNPGFVFRLTNGVFYQKLLSTGPNSAGSWSLNGTGSSGTTFFNLVPGFSLTNKNGYIAGTPVLASGITTNSVVITAWENSNNSGHLTSTNFTFIVYSATPGSLLVTSGPPTASSLAANLTWNLDGGAWQTNGITNNFVLPGSHTVNFTNLSGWLTPAAQNVTITSSTLTSVSATYVVNTTGAVTVNLGPAGAVTAGAHWQVDGGAAQNSGATVASLTAGSHTVAFTAQPGWVTPASQSTTITAGVTNLVTGTYVQVGIPSITNLTVLGTNLTLKGSGTAGAAYSVLVSNSIAGASTNWPVISTGIISGGSFQFTTNINRAASGSFFRIRSQ